MPRWFNTTGACNPHDHFMLPTWERLPQVSRLINQKEYFVVHAPRGVGKTTSLQTFARDLTAKGSHVAVLISMLEGGDNVEDVGTAELAILSSWRRSAREELPPELRPPPWPDAPPRDRIGAALNAWAHAAAPKPLVLFLDEFDSLRDSVLLSVLRQIQVGHRHRPSGFPWSLAFVGLRDVRDYRLASDDEGRRGTPSPFNIVDKSITLAPFDRSQIAELYGQYTQEKGQPFEQSAVDRVFELTRGQPWLVNALAQTLTVETVPDGHTPITADHVDSAKTALIRDTRTHIDSLGERLNEPRVKAIIEPILAGTTLSGPRNDDIRYVQDLGLVRMRESGGLEAANPIYREIIVQELTFGPLAALPQIEPTWLEPGGRMNVDRLLEAFVAFWRQHGEPLLQAASYHEIAPHLVLMAFLDRVADRGGTLEREYAIGSGRMDLCLRYGPDVVAIEIKVWRDGRRDPVEDGLEQIDRYLAGLNLARGWLVIFNQRKEQPPVEQRVTVEPRMTPGGRAVSVIRA
ncbi:AAA family ATPase [Sorangium sp. So ce394]|uniref:AAA family ATPase n=1 Tax=Sorangium sp. So ce394 TaxID=3133310 RepID=UPI003F5BB473